MADAKTTWSLFLGAMYLGLLDRPDKGALDMFKNRISD